MSDPDILVGKGHDDRRLDSKLISISMAKLTSDDLEMHSTITLNDVLDKIADDSGFYKPTDETVTVDVKSEGDMKDIGSEASNTIGSKIAFDSWLSKIRTDLIEKHYPNYELRKLRMIVIGSSRRTNGTLGLAFDEYSVDDRNHWNMDQLLRIINRALGLRDTRKNTRYDYFSTDTKDQVLFMDILLGESFNNEKLAFAAYSLKFINLILSKAKNQKIVIIDTRENEYVCLDDEQVEHYNNDNYRMDGDKKYKHQFQKDQSFKINYFDNHEYVFIGDLAESLQMNLEIFKTLNEKGFPIDRLYIFDRKTNKEMKGQLLKIIDYIENDSDFKKKMSKFRIFKDELENLLNSLDFKEHFNGKDASESELKTYKYNKWFGDIKEFIENNCLFEPNKLKTIVIGSVGFENFCTSTAFVAQDFSTNYSGVPNSVKNFSDFLDGINYANGFKLKYTDFHAKQAREQGFMFLNTCLSTCLNEAINSVCTVEFINRILLDAADKRQKLAVLDMRLTRYVSECEIIEELEQDLRFSGYCQSGDAFKLVNPEGFHHLVRLGNPVFWSGNSNEEEYITDRINFLMNEGYEISCIYLSKGDYDTVKKQMSNSSDNSNQRERSSHPERDDEVSDESLEEYSDESSQESSDQNEIIDNTSSKENKLSPEIVLRVLLTFASKFKWSLEKKNYKKIKDIDRFTKSKVCDSFYFKYHQFVLIWKSHKEALIFDVDDKPRRTKIEFIGITIQYQKQQSQFILTQSKAIETIKAQNLNEDNVGSVIQLLIDLSSKTRPDICATVDLLQSYIAENPEMKPPIDVIEDLIVYLYSSKDSQLIINGSDLGGNSDASYKGEMSLKSSINDETNIYSDQHNSKEKNNNEGITKVKTTTVLNNHSKSVKTEIYREKQNKTKQATQIDQNRSQLGTIVRVFGTPVAWLSEKEKGCQSSGKLEIIAQIKISHLFSNIIDLKKEIYQNFFVDNRIPPSMIPLHTDHLGKKEKNVKEVGPLYELYKLAERVNIVISHVRSNNNVADLLTRKLFLNQNKKTRENNADIRDRLGLKDSNKSYSYLKDNSAVGSNNVSEQTLENEQMMPTIENGSEIELRGDIDLQVKLSN